MTRQRMRFIQLGLEALIPLLGFFAWDWSLYFILLFYFLDMLAAELIMQLKSGKIVECAGRPVLKGERWKYTAVSVVVLLTSIALIHGAMLWIQQGILFPGEIVAFWTYEELGMQQGYVFVPLVFLMGYQQYKMEFLMPARYRNAQLSTIWRSHIQANSAVGIAALVCLSLAVVITLPEIVYVLGIVACTTVYKLRFSN